jgi:transposase
MMCRRARVARFVLSKTTRKTYAPKLEMAVAIDVVRGDKTLSQVAAGHGAGPSLAAEWRDEPLGGADDVFGKTRQDRERRRSEGAARKRHDEAPRKIGQPAVRRDFPRRLCDDNGHGPEGARRGRRAARGAAPREGARAAGGGPRHRPPRHGAPRDGRRRRRR